MHSKRQGHRPMMPRPRLVMVLIVAGLLGTGAFADDNPEQKAVQFVEKVKGKVYRDDKAKGKPVIQVDLTETAVTDADLASIRGFKGLRFLVLQQTKVADGCVKHLKYFPELEGVYLGETAI